MARGRKSNSGNQSGSESGGTAVVTRRPRKEYTETDIQSKLQKQQESSRRLEFKLIVMKNPDLKKPVSRYLSARRRAMAGSQPTVNTDVLIERMNKALNRAARYALAMTSGNTSQASSTLSNAVQNVDFDNVEVVASADNRQALITALNSAGIQYDVDKLVPEIVTA